MNNLLIHQFFKFVNGIDIWGFIFFGLPILGLMICGTLCEHKETVYEEIELDEENDEIESEELFKTKDIPIKLSTKDIFEIEQIIKRNDKYNNIEDIISDYLAKKIK